MITFPSSLYIFTTSTPHSDCFVSVKAYSSIVFTLDGIDTSFKFLHPTKAAIPIETIPSCNVQLSKAVQPLKALSGISVILCGSFTLLRYLHFLNTPYDKREMLSGIMTSET